MTAFPPDKGEFANQTHFLRENGETVGKFHAALFPAEENTGVAITSDGPEHLMFKLPNMEPGKIFNQMMTDLHDQNLTQQDLMDYLTRPNWNNDPRGTDDRSIAILAPVSCPQTCQSATAIVTEAATVEPPTATVTISAMPETASVPPKPIEQKPVATIQQTANNNQPSAKPSIDIFARPVQAKRPSATFVCNMRMFRIICSVFCLTICLMTAIGIIMVKQMRQLKSTVAEAQLATASIPEATAAEEDSELEPTMDQKVDGLETPHAQDGTAANQEQQSTEPQAMPTIQESKQDDQPQKPAAQEDAVRPQPPVAPEQPKKQDEATADGHVVKHSAEGEDASIKRPTTQSESQKQTK